MKYLCNLDETHACVRTCVCYLSKDGVFAAGVETRVVTVLHGQAAVDVEAGHEAGFIGLRVLQTLNN